MSDTKYRCNKCNHGTSGIFQNGNMQDVLCPRCKSILVECMSCHTLTSTTKTEDGFTCDVCKTEFINPADGKKFQTEVNKKANKSAEVILSGIRATGRMHLGNYFGAIKQFLRHQEPGNTCLYFIADWHSLTTIKDPRVIRNNLIEMVKDYLAAGLDPGLVTLYRQSDIPEIAELSLYLGMDQPTGELERIPTFKEKIKDDPDSVKLGLLSYPVLMAADILGPQATLVPVGKDQAPHVELTIKIAKRFNNRFGRTFVIPRMSEVMIKVPGLNGGKMGKSESDNAVDIHLPMDEIRQLYYRKGITDKQRTSATTPGRPQTHCLSVYPLHELITPGEIESRDIAGKCSTAAIGCRECKSILVDNLSTLLEPFQEKRRALEGKSNDDLVMDILHTGGRKARAMIVPTIEVVREKMGIKFKV